MAKPNTNDFEHSSQVYFNEISKFKPLSKEEEYSLWERYKKSNDLRARDKLIKANLKFVASVAKKYQGMGLSYSDLIAEGNYGLMKAIDKFDHEKGYKTISYSVWWIKQTILEALNERNEMKTEDLQEDYGKQIEKNDDDTPNTENDTENSPNELIFNGELTSNPNEIKLFIENLMDCLNEREAYIISEYFGLNHKETTLEDIGSKLGLTKERVRQIKEKALKKLRSEALAQTVYR